MVIVFPEGTESIINGIRNAIGRPVIFYVVASSTACPDCFLDPITNTSDDSFCTTCEGVYWIPVLSGVTISAHISWGKSDQARWETGGVWYEGSCGLQIERTDANIIVVESAVSVTVDEKEMEIRKIIHRGVKNLNRLLLDVIELEK